jgi:competence protein ComFC
MTDSTQIYYFYRLIWTGLDLLFPPNCAGCGKPGSRWCEECRRNTVLIQKPYCDICGIPLSGKSALCTDCLRNRPCFRILRSWSAFEAPLRTALHRLKYRHDISLGDSLAEQLSEFVSNLNWPIDLVVPVPLGQKRLKERGYNQVGLIAFPLSLSMNIAYSPEALCRNRETRSQVGLTKSERHVNVRGAFHADETRVKGRVTLLIDDVATTGSTLSSCAEALYTAGAKDVYSVTVARALPYHHINEA